MQSVVRASKKTVYSAPIGVIARAALVARGHLSEDEEPEPMAPAPPIPPEDERDLKRYFEHECSQAYTTGSNYDTMLERMGAYLRESYPCTHCGGWDEIRDDDDEVIRQEKPGTGHVTDSHQFQEWAQIERLCGRPTDLEAVQIWLRKHNEAAVTCPKCEGWGWRFRWLRDPKRPPTVQITGQIPRHSPPTRREYSEILQLITQVGKRRVAMRAVDPFAEQLLEAYYSPGGGLKALWRFTRWGRRLLRLNRDGLPSREYFRRLVVQGADTSRGDAQAESLRNRMCWAWIEVSKG